MSARGEVARLLAEHSAQMQYDEGDSWPGDGAACSCGWEGVSQRDVAEHLAHVLDAAGLLRAPRPKSPGEMTGREFADGIEAATRAEIERLRRESHP